MWARRRLQSGVIRPRRGRNSPGHAASGAPAIWNRPARCGRRGCLCYEQGRLRRPTSGILLSQASLNLAYPLVMHHALSLSIARGRGDVVTRFTLLLSADADATLQTGPRPFSSEVGTGWREESASNKRSRFRLAQIGPNKILAGIRAEEFSTRIGVRRSAGIAIFPAGLNMRVNDIPYAAHAALEIDHARTIGGSPPAPLRTLGVPPGRNRIPYRGALWRAGADRGRRVRHVLGSSVLGVVFDAFSSHEPVPTSLENAIV